MIVLGALAIAAVIGYVLVQQAHDGKLQGPVWPIAFAGAIALYIWWFGALMYDLIVVWHLYIRSSRINRKIRAMTGPVAHKAAPASLDPHSIADAT